MAQILPVFVSLCLLFQASWGSAIPQNVGVTGGNAIQIERANYMALLYTNLDAPCGGVIIDKRYILTASTCCNQNARILHAFVGTDRKEDLGQAVTVDSFIKYPQELKPTICLVKLRDPLRFNAKVNKIPLDDGSMILDRYTWATLTAFGAEKKDDQSPRQLRQGLLPISESDWCKKESQRLNGALLCAGDRNHNGCYGDVGGALTVKGTLVGVVADVPNDCAYRPSRFSRISAFKNWIDQTIKQ